MTIAAAGAAAKGAASKSVAHGAASQVVPSGKSDHEQQILLLLVLAGVIIFIQHDVSGKPQEGTQYAALGIVGFLLLVLSQFWPEVALTFTILFVVAVVLNSPNGVPLVSKATSANGSIPAGGSAGGSSGGSSSGGSSSGPVSTKPINISNVQGFNLGNPLNPLKKG